MKTVALELTVSLTTIDDQVLPDQTRLIEQLMDCIAITTKLVCLRNLHS